MAGKNKKEAYGGFLKPNAVSPYADNLRSIFIDKNENDLKHEPENFLEASLVKKEILRENEITPSTIGDENEEKLGTKWVKTGYKGNIEPGTNQVQTGYNHNNIEPELGTNQVQTKSITRYITRDKVGTNRVQSGCKSGTKTFFSELTGLQRDIIISLCHECKKTRTKVTEPLTIEYLTASLNRTYDAIKTSIKRLEKKGCIIRVKFKNGRGGWSQYEIPEDIYHDALHCETGYKVSTNQVQSRYKLGSEPGSELGTTVSSSSSLNINKTTTELSDEWNFDITPYARFGFTQTQLKQVASLGTITATDVEQSLIEFSYDIDNNALPIIKTTKINFLMGLLRSGNTYISEGFKNEQEAMIAEMAKRSADKRKRLSEEKFEAWMDNQNEEDRKIWESIIPNHLKVRLQAYGMDDKEVKSWLFDYYLSQKPTN